MSRIVPADAGGISLACGVLRRGGLVAFPTETVYGLGAIARDGAAVRRVFAAKGRPADNPVIVHVLGVRALSEVAREVSPASRALAEALWPGPLTLVLPRAREIPDVVTAGGDTVAVRAPAHPAAQALLAALGEPLAAPSANRSGELSPTSAEDVARSLGARVELILDGGPCDVGIESTVVRADDELTVLRPGVLDGAALARIARIPLVESAIGHEASPGTRHRHYAPGVPMCVVRAAKLAARVRAVHGVSLTWTMPGDARLPADEAGYARGLYAALRELAGRGRPIVVEEVPAAWTGVRDRLARAAAANT